MGSRLVRVIAPVVGLIHEFPEPWIIGICRVDHGGASSETIATYLDLDFRPGP